MRAFLLTLVFSTFTLFASNLRNDSIVKISATLKEYDYSAPWSPPETSNIFASGFIIEGNQIITNAHAVNNASFIQVRSSSSNELFEARVKVIGHDCDLALLEVEDPMFFEDKNPLKFKGTLLQQREEVEVVGFPMGGIELSVTKGIVSRSEITPYVHSMVSLLSTQIDAPINPGNSGGPVFSGDEVVGIAHQGMNGGQNIGYMIPIPIIRHFLEEIEKGTYEGFPGGALKVQQIQSSAMRKYYGLEKNVGALLVIKIPEKHFFHDILKPGDILLEIDGHVIDTYGQIKDEELNLSLPYSYLITKKHFGDEVTLRVIRGEGEIELSTFMDPKKKGTDIVSAEFDKSPTYYIAGGLVFQPLVLDGFRDIIDLRSGIEEGFHYLGGESVKDKDEIIVLSRILKDAANLGYHEISKKIVEKVNGKAIRNMRELIETIETLSDPFLFIETADHIEIILEREATLERTPKILNRYFISSDRSADLQQSR